VEADPRYLRFRDEERLLVICVCRSELGFIIMFVIG
jgi:hypothetical protein